MVNFFKQVEMPACWIACPCLWNSLRKNNQWFLLVLLTLCS